MKLLSGNAKVVIDWPLLIVTLAIATLGVVNLYSATSAPGAANVDMYIQQIYWITLGTALAVVVVLIDYRNFEHHGWALYGMGIAMLILVFLLAPVIRGSQRWIPIGSFSLQPSEFMKLGLIVALAKHLHHDRKTYGRTLKDLVIPGLIVAAPMALILKQPDLGTGMIILAIFTTIMLLTHLKLRSFITLVTTLVLSAPLTWHYLLKDYQRERFLTFLQPEADILDSGWHTHQSVVAIGNGGWIGKGYMQGTQNQHRFLPDQHSDFPFTVWAEEHGLLGSLFLLALYLFLVLWGLRIAYLAKDRFGAVVAVGVSGMIFWQAIINLGMVCGVLPVVGVTLPLFSYGGSSLLTIMIGLGLLMNISIRRFTY